MISSTLPSDSSSTITLAVTGMHCQSCVDLVGDSLSATPGVVEASVDLEAGRAFVVVHSGASVSPDELCAAVVAAGYGAVAVPDS